MLMKEMQTKPTAPVISKYCLLWGNIDDLDGTLCPVNNFNEDMTEWLEEEGFTLLKVEFRTGGGHTGSDPMMHYVKYK